MMKSILAIVGLALIFNVQAHEHSDMSHLVFANGAIHAHVTWEKGPEVHGESVLKIEWKNGADHSPTKPPGHFEVYLIMPSMGQGSAPNHIRPALDAQETPLVGVFVISNIFFVMPGDWGVTVAVTYQDGLREAQTINVRVTDGGHHHH